MGDDPQQQGPTPGRAEDLQPSTPPNQLYTIDILLQQIQGLQQKMQEMHDVQNIIRQ